MSHFTPQYFLGSVSDTASGWLTGGGASPDIQTIQPHPYWKHYRGVQSLAQAERFVWYEALPQQYDNQTYRFHLCNYNPLKTLSVVPALWDEVSQTYRAQMSWDTDVEALPLKGVSPNTTYRGEVWKAKGQRMFSQLSGCIVAQTSEEVSIQVLLSNGSTFDTIVKNTETTGSWLISETAFGTQASESTSLEVVYTSVTPFYYLATGIGANPKQIAIRLTGTHDFLSPLVSATGQGWQYTNNGIQPQMY